MNNLNNTRGNLRICSCGQNTENRPKINKKTSSEYKGVFWHSGFGRWEGRIKKNGKTYCKKFMNEINAAKWYDDMAKKLFGEFARTNFTETTIPLLVPEERKVTSAYKGVCYDKTKNKWKSEIKKDKKRHFLGYYKTEHLAAIAYMEKHFDLYGGRRTVLFSGKFSMPHPGHFSTIMSLAKDFGSVKVVILDYPERGTTVEYALRVFNDIFKYTVLDVSFFVSPIHFGKITKHEIDQFGPFDVYAAGNMEVLKHVESIGVRTYFVPRSFSYKSSLIQTEKL